MERYVMEDDFNYWAAIVIFALAIFLSWIIKTI
jgi:hypothetical protein